jgi:hypothetical protein
MPFKLRFQFTMFDWFSFQTFSNDVCLLGRLEPITFPYLCLSVCATVLCQEKAIRTCIHAFNQLSFCLDMVVKLSAAMEFVSKILSLLLRYFTAIREALGSVR